MPTGTRSSISTNSTTKPTMATTCSEAHRASHSTGLIWYWPPRQLSGWKISR